MAVLSPRSAVLMSPEYLFAFTELHTGLRAVTTVAKSRETNDCYSAEGFNTFTSFHAPSRDIGGACTAHA